METITESILPENYTEGAYYMKGSKFETKSLNLKVQPENYLKSLKFWRLKF